MLFDTLPTRSTNGVGKVYHWLKNILSTTTVQQAESSLQHRFDASVLTPDCSRAGGQGADQALSQNLRYANLRLGGHDNHEGHSLSPEGPGPKAFGSSMHGAHFSQDLNKERSRSCRLHVDQVPGGVVTKLDECFQDAYRQLAAAMVDDVLAASGLLMV
jgi:hypothetical protein